MVIPEHTFGRQIWLHIEYGHGRKIRINNDSVSAWTDLKKKKTFYRVGLVRNSLKLDLIILY